MILLALMALVSKVFVDVTILKIAGMVQMKSIAVSSEDGQNRIFGALEQSHSVL